MKFNSLKLSVLIAVTLVSSGCAFWKSDRIHYSWESEAAAPCETCTPSPTGSDFVGIALSGGGARAAVFAAAAIEVLAEEGLMQRATHISSVSGGGFAASYYALNKPQPCTADAETSETCVSESYAEFKQAMRYNYLSHMTRRQFVKLNRFSSSTRRLSSLQDVLDKKFIDGAAFGDLAASPVLLFNASRFDDGRRFVFSNQPIAEQHSDIEPFTKEKLRTASFSLPGCARATPKDFSVALAVAISAGFPPLLGPASFSMPTNCDGDGAQYWHLGDGGILDNSGVDTLTDYALNARADTNSDATPVERIFIFALDAGRSTGPEAMMSQDNLKLWTRDPGRVVDIVGMRANAYRALALAHAQENYTAPITLVNIAYTDARVETWPASCGPRIGDVTAISTHIAQIPTNFKISDCDADLIELAARDIVTRTLADQRSALESAGFHW